MWIQPTFHGGITHHRMLPALTSTPLELLSLSPATPSRNFHSDAPLPRLPLPSVGCTGSVLLPLLASSLSSGFTGTTLCALQPLWLHHQYRLQQFLSPGSSVCHRFLALAASHSYLWISKLMWVSSMLCLLREIQKNKSSSDKHQRLKCSWQTGENFAWTLILHLQTQHMHDKGWELVTRKVCPSLWPVPCTPSPLGEDVSEGQWKAPSQKQRKPWPPFVNSPSPVPAPGRPPELRGRRERARPARTPPGEQAAVRGKCLWSCRAWTTDRGSGGSHATRFEWGGKGEQPLTK